MVLEKRRDVVSEVYDNKNGGKECLIWRPLGLAKGGLCSID
jgi:hypothetical protein